MYSRYKNISKTVMLHLFFKLKKKMFKNVKKIEKIHMDSEKSINSFKIKKG